MHPFTTATSEYLIYSTISQCSHVMRDIAIQFYTTIDHDEKNEELRIAIRSFLLFVRHLGFLIRNSEGRKLSVVTVQDIRTMEAIFDSNRRLISRELDLYAFKNALEHRQVRYGENTYSKQLDGMYAATEWHISRAEKSKTVGISLVDAFTSRDAIPLKTSIRNSNIEL